MKAHSYGSFSELPPGYGRLFELAAQESFFLSRIWYEVLAHTVLEPNQEPVIYALEDGSEPRAALVCRREVGGHQRPRVLSSLSNFYTMRYAPLMGPNAGQAEETLDQLMQALNADNMPWDRLEFRPLDSSTQEYSNLIRALSRTGWIVHPYFVSGNWYEVTEGRSFDEYKKKLPSGTRRLERKFNEASNIRFEMVTGGPDLEQSILDYETVYAASWKESESYPGFFPELLRKGAAAGVLRLGLLYVDDAPSAAQIWLVSGGGATIYKVAYDEAYKKLSVGSILNLLMMRHVMDVDKVSEVDFGSGDDKYKAVWMSHRRENWGIVAYNRYTIWGALEGFSQIAKNWVRRLSHRGSSSQGTATTGGNKRT